MVAAAVRLPEPGMVLVFICCTAECKEFTGEVIIDMFLTRANDSPAKIDQLDLV